MCVRVGNLKFHDWVSLELPGGWSDTFIFRMAPTEGLPPGDYAGVVRALAVPLRKLRPSASLWVRIGSTRPTKGDRDAKHLSEDQINKGRTVNPGLTLETGNWYQSEVRYALRGLRLPVAVTGRSSRPQFRDFSFFPQVDPRPYPQPPGADPLLKEGTYQPSELACLRVLARSNCAYTAEVASLADLSRTGALVALHRLAERRLVVLETKGKYPLWRVRRPGVSSALRSWGVPPGVAFRLRRERGRRACTERIADRQQQRSQGRSKRRISFTGKRSVAFMALDTSQTHIRRRSSRGRHRRTARLWPAWLRRAWPQAEVWAGWTEVASGRGRPDALCWGQLDGCETLCWLEVESGHDSRAKAVQKTLRRVNQALLYARRSRVRLIFVTLGPPWVCNFLTGIFPDLPADLGVVLADWKHFGELPRLVWGRLKRRVR